MATNVITEQGLRTAWNDIKAIHGTKITNLETRVSAVETDIASAVTKLNGIIG